MYGFVWKESDYKMIEELWHNNVKLIILKPNESNKLEGWYNLKDLEDIYSWVIEQLNTNPDYFKLVKKRFYQYLTPMIPFLEGKAKINNFKELKEYYHNWLHWWSPMDSFLLIPDFEGIPQKIKKEALKIREETHKYTDNLDRPFVEFFTKKFPEYKELVNIILPQEVFILEKTKLSKEEEEKIKQRKKGCVLFPDEVILLKDLKLKLEEAHIKLNRTAEPVTSQIKGNVAYSGKVKGLVRVILYKEDLKNLKDKEIIVTEMTSPEFMPAIKKASAIVTDEGGITCHAAIISRELKKPCIIGTKIATQVLHDGDLVEVDADNGIVKIIKKA
jgi:phosphohistidine swiveling domain-containing protein